MNIQAIARLTGAGGYAWEEAILIQAKLLASGTLSAQAKQVVLRAKKIRVQ